jgi:hypothetical protein
MKSFKLFNEKCNNKKNFKNNTIRKNSEKSQEFGQIRKVGKQSEKTSKFGNFRKIRMIWQPWEQVRLNAWVVLYSFIFIFKTDTSL